jgi:hypothetical protein
MKMSPASGARRREDVRPKGRDALKGGLVHGSCARRAAPGNRREARLTMDYPQAKLTSEA